MVAEYEDASFAREAVSRGRKVNENLKLKDVMVSVKLHRPDIPDHLLAPQFDPMTPTRSGEQSSLSGAMGSMSIKDPIASTHSPSHIPYMATPQNFSIPNSVPYVMGGLNSVYVPSVVGGLSQAYPPSVLPQVNLGLGYAFTPSPYHQATYIQTGFGYTGTAFQPAFGNDFGYYDQRSAGQSRDGFGFSDQQSPGQSRDVGPYNRQISRHQYASRVHSSRDRHNSNQANNHHNQVDVNRIRQGTDVRTTVGFTCLQTLQQ